MKTLKLRGKWPCTPAIPEFDERQRQEWETQPNLRLTQKLQQPEQCGMSGNMECRPVGKKQTPVIQLNLWQQDQGISLDKQPLLQIKQKLKKKNTKHTF